MAYGRIRVFSEALARQILEMSNDHLVERLIPF